MALIKCSECSRDISDQAATCPGCGAPVVVGEQTTRAPDRPSLIDGRFSATRDMMAAICKSAVQASNYRVDAVDEAAGTITFTTGMTMGSWAGVSGTIVYNEVSPYLFEVSGAAKQNVRGGQVVALDLFGEAKSKIDNVIIEMKRQAGNGEVDTAGSSSTGAGGTGCAVILAGSLIASIGLLVRGLI